MIAKQTSFQWVETPVLEATYNSRRIQGEHVGVLSWAMAVLVGFVIAEAVTSFAPQPEPISPVAATAYQVTIR